MVHIFAQTELKPVLIERESETKKDTERETERERRKHVFVFVSCC